MKRMIVFFLLIISSLTYLSGQATLVLQPGPEGKDAKVWSIEPDLNQGDNPKFAALGWTFSSIEGAARSLIDFDLSGIPSGVFIKEAWLYLYYFSDEPIPITHTGDNQGYLKLITGEWEEDQVTWNTQPMTSGEHMVYMSASTDPEQDYEIDVTSLIRLVYNNPGLYHGMMLQLQSELPYRCLLFASSDNDDPELWPKLVVTYCGLPVSSFVYETSDKTVFFTDSTESATSWWWDFGDGYFSNQQHPVHSYQATGHYQVCLTVTDSCGEDTYCDSVKVYTAGLFEAMQNKIAIWPNPAGDVIAARLPTNGAYAVRIINSSGILVKEIWDICVEDLYMRLDISDLSQGFYLLVISDNDFQGTGRLIVYR